MNLTAVYYEVISCLPNSRAAIGTNPLDHQQKNAVFIMVEIEFKTIYLPRWKARGL